MTETQFIKSEERGKKYEVEFEVFDPKVKIKNNVYPLPWEFHNCGTCRSARFLQKPEPGVLRVKCLLSGLWIDENEGTFDNGCPGHRRAIPRREIIGGVTL
jgi:hypothetical protein